MGNGANTHPQFAFETIAQICKKTGCQFREANNHFEAQGAQDAAVEASGALKTVDVSLMKIANDIRWLASGPRAALGEILLPELQPGSSIMPGKANPSQCEALMMIAVQIISADCAVSFAGSQGNLELNTMRPLVIRTPHKPRRFRSPQKAPGGSPGVDADAARHAIPRRVRSGLFGERDATTLILMRIHRSFVRLSFVAVLPIVSLLAAADVGDDRRIERGEVADHLEADAVAMQLVDLLLEGLEEELHEEIDFLAGAAPVLAGEGEEREAFQPREAQAFTTSRTASTPRRCPATRGRYRFFAQYVGYLLTEKDSWWGGYKAITPGPTHSGGLYFKGHIGL